MDTANDVIEMFLTADAARARALAVKLHDLNTGRQQTEAEITRSIFEQCVSQPVTDTDAALVFASAGWHRGVVGIVASRVVERFHRPAIILGVQDGVAQGSGRSIEAFHLLDALESMRELFTKFGGHAHAAGLTLPESSLGIFRERLRAWAGERLTAEDMRLTVDVDAVVQLPDINDALWQALERIAPFGMGNRRPLFAARGVELAGPPQIWNTKHIRLAARQGGRTVMMKGWGMSDLADELQNVRKVDVAFEIERDWFGGWGLTLRACRACEAAAAVAGSE
jgi:single-stranded-DNA-specific exonuclease